MNRDNKKIINILFLGRIGKRKGIYDLIDVIASDVNYFRSRCRFQIGGDGEVDNLNSLIKE